jgi:hypothetical protein
LADAEEVGTLGVVHLKRLWSRTLRGRAGLAPSTDELREWDRDDLVVMGLGLNLRETFDRLHHGAPAFAAFEAWVAQRAGDALAPAHRARLNAALRGEPVAASSPAAQRAPVLDADDLAFFAEHGYVVVHDAAPQPQCAAAAQAIWSFLGADPDDPSTWYGGPQGHSIWVPLLRHPALWANRRAPRIHGAFAQLWGRDDLWPNVDQVGFNPPERAGWPFPGPRLHWDVSLAPPIPLALKGLLYLVDVAADQGAFTCVPGFHRRIDAWLAALPPGADPRAQDLEALGPVPVAGRAGDLVIWHEALPHGSSPNRAALPRLVQYLGIVPSTREVNPVWR